MLFRSPALNARAVASVRRRWPASLDRPATWGFVLLLCLGWNASMLVKRQTDFGHAWLVGFDDNFYLGWGRSLAVDGDWNFENDVAFAASLVTLGATSAHFQAWLRQSERTSTGRVPNKYEIGRASCRERV